MDWETHYASLQIGQQLWLRREHDNPHDGNAILVLDDEENKLGYIPKYQNRGLAKRLDAGEEICTLLLKVDRQKRTHQLYIEVFVKKQGESV